MSDCAELAPPGVLGVAITAHSVIQQSSLNRTLHGLTQLKIWSLRRTQNHIGSWRRYCIRGRQCIIEGASKHRLLLAFSKFQRLGTIGIPEWISPARVTLFYVSHINVCIRYKRLFFKKCKYYPQKEIRPQHYFGTVFTGTELSVGGRTTARSWGIANSILPVFLS